MEATKLPESLKTFGALTEFKRDYQKLRYKAASKIKQVFGGDELAEGFFAETALAIAEEEPSRRQERQAVREGIQRGVKWLKDLRDKLP